MEQFLKYYSYAKSQAWLVCKDKDLAEDITQTVFLKICNSKTQFSFKYDSEIKAYLKRAVKNEYINHYRVKVKNTIVDIDSDYFKDTLPEEKIDSNYSDEMRYALSFVPAPLKICFIMAHLHEYKYNEIADFLDIPEGSVKNRVHRAKEELKYRIEKFRKMGSFRLTT